MSYPKIAVIFNAPPRIGKDTLARLLPEWLSGPVKYINYKDALYSATEEEILPEFRELIPEWGSEEYDNIKDDSDFRVVLRDGFEGTLREALIHVSEDIIKPKYGAAFFGGALAKCLRCGYNLIADGGFPDETQAVVDVADFVLVVQIFSDDHTFEGDSRAYLNPDDFPEAVFIELTRTPVDTPYDLANELGKMFIAWELVNVPAMHDAIPAPYRSTFV